MSLFSRPTTIETRAAHSNLSTCPSSSSKRRREYTARRPLGGPHSSTYETIVPTYRLLLEKKYSSKTKKRLEKKLFRVKAPQLTDIIIQVVTGRSTGHCVPMKLCYEFMTKGLSDHLFFTSCTGGMRNDQKILYGAFPTKKSTSAAPSSASSARSGRSGSAFCDSPFLVLFRCVSLLIRHQKRHIRELYKSRHLCRGLEWGENVPFVLCRRGRGRRRPLPPPPIEGLPRRRGPIRGIPGLFRLLLLFLQEPVRK